MKTHRNNISMKFILLMCSVVCILFSNAASVAQDKKPPAKQPPAVVLPLSEEQKILQQKFARLEELLLKLAKVSNLNDPQRSELLRETFKKGKELQVLNQYKQLVEMLKRDDLANMKQAVARQKEIQTDLKKLLDLLQSEDRAREVEDRRKRIRAYIKDLNRIIREEKGIHNRTTGGDDLKPLSDRQAKVAKKTEKLGKDIKKNEEKDNSNDNDSKDDNKTDNKKDGGKPDKKTPTKKNPDKNNPDSKKSDKNNPDKKDSGSKPKDGSKNAEPGKNGNGQEGKPSDKDNPQANPARQRIEDAQKKMRQAQQDLDQAKRDDAAEKQRTAIEQLEKAKAELEKILRQLREEEIQRTLAMLEVRFKKMLQSQQAINDDTKQLATIPLKAREEDGDFEIKAGRLARREQQNVFACTKALTLLREEGSAVALPEAVREVQEDMKRVTNALGEADVSNFTQAIQSDIVVSLEEIIGALQQAQIDQENRKKQNQGRPMGQGESADPPLVDQLAELRMIRALQMRVNRMTKRYSAMKVDDRIDQNQLNQRLGNLSQRQKRVFKATKDIATGKNQ